MRAIKLCLSLILSVFVISVFAQKPMNGYEKSWQRIDSLIGASGLLKTALKEVDLIYAKAKKENNQVQQIRALVYRTSLNDQLVENSDISNIGDLEKEADSTPEPAKSILNSIAAGRYWNYLQRNRWKFYNRSNTKGYQKEDISSWNLTDLHARISALFLASLESADLLKKTSLDNYDPILEKGNMRHLRPTLYDLLAHRAVDYFRNDERNITSPSFRFEISDSSAFDEADSFSKAKFNTLDTTSLHYRALRLFQDLLRFHQSDKDPAALIDADLERLGFVNSNSTHPDKEELYKKSLEALIRKYPDHPSVDQASYLLAEWYAREAAEYTAFGDTTNRYAYVKALEIVKTVVQRKDSSEGKINSLNLAARISMAEVRTEAETVNLPGQPFRVLVKYRNLGRVYFKLIKLNRKVIEEIGRDTYSDKYWTAIEALPVIRTFQVDLPDTRDHQLHSTEIKVDALPTGQYALIGTSSEQPGAKAGSLLPFHVSGIAYINRDRAYYVVDRNSGSPLAGSRIQEWTFNYNNNRNKYDLRRGETYISDKDGFFELSAAKRTNNYYNAGLEINYKGDSLFLNDNIRTYYYNQETSDGKQDTRTFFFTDRSLYRPGQTVYLKGIVIRTKTKNLGASVVAKRATWVHLYDANDQQVDSIKVTTNEFGSFTGKFTIPTNTLNGNFRIQENSNDGSTGIKVEEYKRPKFQVEIAKPSGTYRVNDSVTVKGTAKAFAGNNISGATVKYRVVRQAMMPMFHSYYLPRIWPPYGREQMEITNGVTTTDANGSFSIVFKAIPDKKIPEKDHPLFHFEVIADVTDINGETQSANNAVTVGFEALKIGVSLPEVVEADSLNKVMVSSTNMNDLFEATAVKLAIFKLSTPSRIFRQRLWDQPDQFTMGREEYYRLFPSDQYSDETDMTKWTREKKITETSGVTVKDSAFTLKNLRPEGGWYVAEASATDKYGKKVTSFKYFRVYEKTLVSPFAGAYVRADRAEAEPGQNLKYTLSSNLDNLHLIHELTRSGKADSREWLQSSGNIFSRDLAVADSDERDIAVNFLFIKNNRFYQQAVNLPVVHPERQLKIDYTSFRDKTLPGKPEKWSVRISGGKKDRIAAELLTAMYDVSLDQIFPHSWQLPSVWGEYFSRTNWEAGNNFTAIDSRVRNNNQEVPGMVHKEYDALKIPLDERNGNVMMRKISARAPGAVVVNEIMTAPPESEKAVVAGFRAEESDAKMDSVPAPGQVSIRKNLQETAFFFPQLHSDSSGNIEFSFTTPEALTEWKWMLLAHTKDLAFAYDEKRMVTQKQLMVQPNPPRFLREGDRMDLSARIVNLSGQEITGKAVLELIDPTNGKSADGLFQNRSPGQFFTAPAGQGVPVHFSITVPYNYDQPVTWRIIASTTMKDSATRQDMAVSDGEESILPVITNRMLVTETLPLSVKANTTRKFVFDKLLKSDSSESLEQHRLTVEYTTNPAWYAIQALPYLAEVRDEQAEQVFNRFYANAIASSIAGSSPRIRAVFEQWKNSDTAALLSNLQKNEELKSILLNETPWVLEAKTESQQKKNIAVLFEMTRLSSELDASLQKLTALQLPEGAFSWFKGGYPDRFITQSIVTGFGHLAHLGVLSAEQQQAVRRLTTPAISWLDQQIKKDYELLRKGNPKFEQVAITGIPVQYLYMRSFFKDIPVQASVFPAYNFYRNQAKANWIRENSYMRGMIALSLFRTGEPVIAKKILAALKESAINNPELGMYWKQMGGGYFWYQAPVESQSVMIEAFSEITNDRNSVDDLKTWLLKNKQTNSWKTGKATADACYALLLKGSDWLRAEPEISISLGATKISSKDQAKQAGTGYFKTSIDKPFIKPSMGDITVKAGGDSKDGSSGWGAVYWQYFEDLEKITAAKTPLKLTKQLFVEKNTASGPVLEAMDNQHRLRVGDKVKVRIELRSDREMEYIHLKDMRAAALEPVNVLSGYNWNGGLGYYQSTKDASVNYYFDHLPKGTHVLEYTLFVTHAGAFSNGITTVQCFYAPEFSSHSEGISINVVAQ